MFAGRGFTMPLPPAFCLSDSGPQIVNATDTTKALQFDLSGEPASTTETIRPPYIIGNTWQGGTTNLANSTAKITITTDCALTLDRPGFYEMSAVINLTASSWNSATVKLLTMKLRRSNNTAADLPFFPGSASYISRTITVPVLAGTSPHVAEVILKGLYETANSDDIIEVWGVVAAPDTSGNVQVTEVNFLARRIF